jgi:hypothetical protein
VGSLADGLVQALLLREVDSLVFGFVGAHLPRLAGEGVGQDEVQHARPQRMAHKLLHFPLKEAMMLIGRPLLVHAVHRLEDVRQRDRDHLLALLLATQMHCGPLGGAGQHCSRGRVWWRRRWWLVPVSKGE